MSASILPSSLLDRSVDLAPAPRAKSLPLRLHSEPDRELEALTSEAALQYKMQAKSRMHTLITELRLVAGEVSGRRLAALWLGSPTKEGTIRCWKDFRDHNRYPRKDDLDRLAAIVASVRRDGVKVSF